MAGGPLLSSWPAMDSPLGCHFIGGGIADGDDTTGLWGRGARHAGD